MTEANLFRAILAAGFAVVIGLALRHRIRSWASKETLDRRQEGLFILLTLRPAGLALWGSVILWLVRPSAMAWSSMPVPVWLQWMGLGVFVAGAVLLEWTLRTLGTNLTDTVVTRQAHTLVTRGPYRWVRHPFYDAMALLLAAFGLMAANWFVLAAGATVFTLLAIRSRTEEDKLLARFGEPYRVYRAGTGRFWPRAFPSRTMGLAAAFVLLSAPAPLGRQGGVAPSWPALTVVFGAALVAITVRWGSAGSSVAPVATPSPPDRRAALLVGVAALVMLAAGLHALVVSVLQTPIDVRRSDMLVVIRAAIERFSHGGDPYSRYDIPYGSLMPYGPVLWAPFMLPQAFHIDLRAVTVAGALFVPVWCGMAATIEAARRHASHAAVWLLLTAAIVFNPDLQRFSTVGHTPGYWPLLLPFAVFVARERWIAAAVLLGLLLAGRSTMVAIVPVFFMTVWLRGRGQWLTSACAFAAIVLVTIGPFIVWNPASWWDCMVASYPRIMKDIVWPSADRGVMKTIGLTGWLLSHGLAAGVEISQAVAMIAVWTASWFALRRGRAPVAWMALSLAVFSMTSLWPVYYLYFDVLLLFACAAIAGVVRPISFARGALAWSASLAGIAAGLIVALLLSATALPSVDAAEVDGSIARVQLPRSSRAPADIVVTGSLDGTPASVEAQVNGMAVPVVRVGSERWVVRLHVPDGAWWIGANELVLSAAPAVMSIHEVRVVPAR